MGIDECPQVGGRVAELTIALSLATDLGTGQPLEQGMQTCLLAVRTAEEFGLDRAQVSTVYHTALLRFIGCTSDASETAVVAGGDELGFNATMAPMLNAGSREQIAHFMRHLGEGHPVHRRIALVARAIADPGAGHRSLSGHCDVAARLGERLGLEPTVIEAMAHAYERWDGTGAPAGLSGVEVPVAVRISTVARDAELWARAAGWPTAVEVLRSRSNRSYDPAVVDILVDHGEQWLAGGGDDLCQEVLDAEPSPFAMVDEVDLDVALLAVADFTDLKSPWLRGHSRSVARLAAAAASTAGLDESGVTICRRAALVHDLGRVGVPSGIWDRPGPLTAEQFERVRMHTYLTERILARSSLLDPYRDVAARHHERADGSGYHRGETADQAALAAQLLAVADAYHAMTEARPHREAMSSSVAADQLRRDAGDGLFSSIAIDAVLAAAGHEPSGPPPGNPAGLTDREVEVLGLIASGHVNKQVARRLGISPKTVGSHLEHIYTKIDVTTRAGATLFAMEHGLVAR